MGEQEVKRSEGANIGVMERQGPPRPRRSHEAEAWMLQRQHYNTLQPLSNLFKAGYVLRVFSLMDVFHVAVIETISVALWKEHAHRFPAEEVMSMSKQAAVAILLLGLTVGRHENQLQLQGSPTWKWYINPAMLETIALQDRYAYMMEPVRLIGDIAAIAAPKPTTVTELFSVEDPHQIWICLALIGVEPGAHDDPAASNIGLICFSPTAEQLIGAPVGALLDAGRGAPDFIPPPIARTFGRQYQFQLSVPQAALGRDRPSFKIDAVEAIQTALLVEVIQTKLCLDNKQ
ncbi:hypothetical protein EJB05_14479 [Eragrostis curvula]|uniref:Uncharacterized protein n=1 Tax=Eragrostis curvula TaxID=38414 RepID=A0A5J9VZC0_9POAL|nr:hypothetical protein EJB05_14479 [Eragrostis curvula]